LRSSFNAPAIGKNLVVRTMMGHGAGTAEPASRPSFRGSAVTSLVYGICVAMTLVLIVAVAQIAQALI
jgi:hypothetical protein